MNDKDFLNIKKQLRQKDEEISQLKNQRSKINKEYITKLKIQSRKNIGRCFKETKAGKIISYCKIINIDKTYYPLSGDINFNEYQYPSIWFYYPYNHLVLPFYIENMFSGAWGKGHDHLAEFNNIQYIEISQDEFNEKFKEVNKNWISYLEENDNNKGDNNEL